MLLLGVALAACTAPTPPLPTATPRPTDLGVTLVTHPAYPSLTYGIQAFLWWNPTTRALDLEHVRQMNFGAVKQIFAWASIQPVKDIPEDWSHADAIVQEVNYRGLKVIARVDSPPDWALDKSGTPGAFPLDLKAWGTFCHDLAARYIGKIAGYQIWNEPNLAREWFGRTPDARGYVTLLQTCYTQIKAADPNAIIISAGLAPTGTTSNSALLDDTFLQQMYASGLSQWYDVLGLNAPGYKSPPETDPGDPALDGHRWPVFRHVEDMRAIQVANGDGAKQIAILEMGWTLDKIHPDYAWFAVTEAQQAHYLVGAYQYAAAHWRPWVGLMVTIYLPDFSWTENDEQYWWAITTPGYNPIMRQAYIDLANMEKVSGNTVIPAHAPDANSYTPLPPASPTR
ncbi:MAG: hypothetical protein ACYDBJ_01195 [Aggregatilineales bacterium]